MVRMTLAMFEVVDVSVAVANASESIRNVCDRMIPIVQLTAESANLSWMN